MNIFERRKPNPYLKPETKITDKKEEDATPDTEKQNWPEGQTVKTIYEASTEAAKDKGDTEAGKKNWYEKWKLWLKKHESF